jgi:HAD superfamily hydrolase (TIGR01509 family)
MVNCDLGHAVIWLRQMSACMIRLVPGMPRPTPRPITDIQVILFDLGGVLVELSGVPALLSWMDNRMTPEELLVMWLSSPVVRSFETGRSSPGEFADHLIKELDLPLESEEFLAEFADWPKSLFPGALELVRGISEDYTVAVLSNSNALHWPRFMDEWGLSNMFDHTFASHLIGKIKPDEEAFKHVVDELGCKASAVLFLDDNMLNVEAARGIGMRAAHVKGVQDARSVLSEAGVLGPYPVNERECQ